MIFLIFDAVVHPKEAETGVILAEKRRELVEELKKEGITDRNVLNAMGNLPREIFIKPALEKRAYENNPLPIGEGQTISQPYIVAYMTQALDIKDGQKILEIGTGSGYQTAILGELNPTGDIYSIEILEDLAMRAKKLLKDLGYDHIHVKSGDGYKGWPSHAPFDRIIVTAAPPFMPKTLLSQLKIGGILIAPIGEAGDGQSLIRIVRVSKIKFQTEKLLGVRFVPMVSDTVDGDHP